MILTLTRDVFLPAATLSVLTIDGKPFGYCCEDVDRGLDGTMALAQIAERKIRGRTAIPTGVYRLGIRYSPKHDREVLYLLDVPGFRFIEVHAGNSEVDTDGCLLPGLRRDTVTGTVSKSAVAVTWLETNAAGPMAAIRAGRAVTIDIGRDGAAWARRTVA